MSETPQKHYMLKLVPCRPDFAQTMTPEEQNIMQQHIAYWKPYLEQGTMIVFGPVFDPAGTFGLGVVAVDSEEELNTLIGNDPASKINTYEKYPMRAVTKG
ncbi:YciI family protein [Chitinophagaceae bacterium MMS25-I14]